jgi:hypothetical protein
MVTELWLDVLKILVALASCSGDPGRQLSGKAGNGWRLYLGSSIGGVGCSSACAGETKWSSKGSGFRRLFYRAS